MQPIKARRIKMEQNRICDWEGHDDFHRKIEKGKYAIQVIGDETIKAQGIFHGKGCYDAALENYKKLKGEIESE